MTWGYRRGSSPFLLRLVSLDLGSIKSCLGKAPRMRPPYPACGPLCEALADGECSAQSVLFDCHQFVARRRATGGPDIGAGNGRIDAGPAVLITLSR